jgi:hypothetical protein
VLATPGGQGLSEGVPIEIEVADVDL